MLRVLSVILLIFCSACSSPREASDAVGGTLRGVSYVVPDRYAEAEGASTERVALFPYERPATGLFLAALPTGSARNALMDEVQQRLAALAVPGEPQAFDWRPNAAPTGNRPASDAETFNERRHGFNGQSRIVVQFRQIRAGERDLLTGYYYVTGTGAEAAQQFRDGTVGDNVVAGAGWASLVGSILGEHPRDLSAPPPPAPGN